jgi:benzodiazapine receptor
MNTYSWYQQLIKPKFAPPAWIFGPVWTILYIIIFISFGTVFYKVFTGQLHPIVALPFTLNLIFNFSFTPLQFGLKSNILAAIDIVLALATLIWLEVYIYPILKWVSLVNIPYLMWVSFATVLQLYVTYLNRVPRR